MSAKEEPKAISEEEMDQLASLIADKVAARLYARRIRGTKLECQSTGLAFECDPPGFLCQAETFVCHGGGLDDFECEPIFSCPVRSTHFDCQSSFDDEDCYPNPALGFVCYQDNFSCGDGGHDYRGGHDNAACAE